MKKVLILIGFMMIAEARFIRHSSDIVMDVQTGFMWQDTTDNNSVEKVWEDTSGSNTASAYCQDLNISFTINTANRFYNDWRLPNYNELITIVDRDSSTDAIDSSFKYYAKDHYWTSTTYKDPTTKAWTINFYYGEDDIKAKDEPHYVRCVRTTGDSDGDGVKD